MVEIEWFPARLAARTGQILRDAQAQKSRMVRFIDDSLYWVVLFIAILGNFIVSVVLVPFLLIFKGVALYASLLFIGVTFGWVLSFLLHSIEKFEQKQRIIVSLFIPALALINVGIFAMLSNKLIVILQLTTPPHNPLLVGALYVFGYVLPEAVHKLMHPGAL